MTHQHQYRTPTGNKSEEHNMSNSAHNGMDESPLVKSMGRRINEVMDNVNTGRRTSYLQTLRSITKIFEEVKFSAPYQWTEQKAFDKSFTPTDVMHGIRLNLNDSLYDRCTEETHFTSFAVDDAGTVIADDAFAYDARNDSIYILLSDPTPWFCNEEIGSSLLEYALQMTQNLYLPHGLFTMIPFTLVSQVMSMRGDLFQGFVLAINFTVDDKTGEPNLIRMFPAKIPKPVILNYKDMDDIIANKNDTNYNHKIPPIALLRDYLSRIQGKMDNFKKWRNGTARLEEGRDPSSELRFHFSSDFRVTGFKMHGASPAESVSKTIISELMMATNHLVAYFAQEQNYEADYFNTWHTNRLDPYLRITNPLRMIESLYNLTCIYNEIQGEKGIPVDQRMNIHAEIVAYLEEDASDAQRNVSDGVKRFNEKMNNVMFLSCARDGPSLNYLCKVLRVTHNHTVKVQFTESGHVQMFGIGPEDYTHFLSAWRRNVEISVVLDCINVGAGSAVLRSCSDKR